MFAELLEYDDSAFGGRLEEAECLELLGLDLESHSQFASSRNSGQSVASLAIIEAGEEVVRP